MRIGRFTIGLFLSHWFVCVYMFAGLRGGFWADNKTRNITLKFVFFCLRVVSNPDVWWASGCAVSRRPSTAFQGNNLCGLRIGYADEMRVGENMPLPKVIALRGLSIAIPENTKRLALYMLHPRDILNSLLLWPVPTPFSELTRNSVR